jgi:LDH2 family malate/lactate/ureidoglycolate dehydrogenase
LGSLQPMFSTNPLSFAAPCGRHAPVVLDMSTSVATVNRIEMHAQEGRSIPDGWACDVHGNPTNDAEAACALLPLGGTALLGGYKGVGLGMMVSIMSGVLSGAWRVVSESGEYEQNTMGHSFAAVRIDSFQPLDVFHSAMDAMIDALHAAPVTDPTSKVSYPGEIESVTAAERATNGIPIDDRLFAELQALARRLELEMPHV